MLTSILGIETQPAFVNPFLGALLALRAGTTVVLVVVDDVVEVVEVVVDDVVDVDVVDDVVGASVVGAGATVVTVVVGAAVVDVVTRVVGAEIPEVPSSPRPQAVMSKPNVAKQTAVRIGFMRPSCHETDQIPGEIDRNPSDVNRLIEN